jgi:hypothetical protein
VPSKRRTEGAPGPSTGHCIIVLANRINIKPFAAGSVLKGFLLLKTERIWQQIYRRFESGR